MAELAPPRLRWGGEGADPGVREVALPDPVPHVGDDFDWEQRDFESYRLAMWTELQARFPERRRWTEGDVEAVLVEALAAQLDQLSDMDDRVSAESHLLSARSVPALLGWLSFIAYRPWELRGLSLDALAELYRAEPHEMELDRLRGPASIRTQRRMVSAEEYADDYAARLREHPLVLRAYTKQAWNGAWLELIATAALLNDWCLDDELGTPGREPGERRRREIDGFHRERGLRMPQWEQAPTIRELLADYVRSFRMAGQVVLLEDVNPVGVVIELCVTLRPGYFQSEVRREVNRVLGRGPDGFFRPGRLAAGQDIQLGDIYQWVMKLDGVADLTLRRFGKLRDNPAAGEVPQAIVMGADELAVCGGAGRGILSVELRGGRSG